MKKKYSLRDRFRYGFDKLMGKGTIALVGMLFLVTAVVVVMAGVIGGVCNGDLTTGNSIWQSLMHAIDAGTLAGDDTANLAFVVLMSIVTICGIFVTSILIGIISSGFEEKLNSLRKGFSVVIEENHSVVIGFNEGIYTILSELIEANANQKRGCILVIGDEEKEVMDEEIKSHISDFKTTEIICRSGKFTNDRILEMASVETARSIIINQQDDFQVIKALLAVTAYLKKKEAFENEAHIVTLIHDEDHLEAAKIAGEGKAEVICLTNVLARIIAHTCRQPGMSLVLTDFFDFDGDEFYFEEFPELVGEQFGNILNLFRKSVVVGLEKKGEPFLNPSMDTIIEAGDKIIHLAEDDGVSFPERTNPKLQLEARREGSDKHQPYHLLVLGYNDSLPLILQELDQYVVKGSAVTLAVCENTELEAMVELDHITFTIEKCNIYRKAVLEALLEKGTEDVLLLSGQNQDTEDADAMTMLLLLQLRDIASKNKIHLNITSEMRSVENQRLSKVAKVNDFVVGTTIANLVLTQVSENRNLLPLFQDLLDADGSEIYMKPANSYVKADTKVNMYTLTQIAKERNEIFVGYKKQKETGIQIVLNPDKNEEESFKPEDYMIVIAED